MQRNTSGKNQGTLVKALVNISKASVDFTPFLVCGIHEYKIVEEFFAFMVPHSESN